METDRLKAKPGIIIITRTLLVLSVMYVVLLQYFMPWVPMRRPTGMLRLCTERKKVLRLHTPVLTNRDGCTLGCQGPQCSSLLIRAVVLVVVLVSRVSMVAVVLAVWPDLCCCFVLRQLPYPLIPACQCPGRV